MSNLTAFLAQNVELDGEMEVIISPRMKDANGPVAWKLRALTSEEDAAIRKSCTKKVAVPGKKGMFMPETDSDLYLARMAAACVVYPDLKSQELQDSYKVLGEVQLLRTMLKPGEYSELINKVQELNGYSLDQDELVDEAKN